MAAISFHNTLHGFWAERETGTAALKENLLQQRTAMSEAVLFKVFLYLWKAYDTLDRERALEIIAAYGVGPRTVRLPRTYWYRLTMVAKSGGYFGRPFKGYQGVTQGDPLPPMIFNGVLDSVIRHWVTLVTPTAEGTGGLSLTIIDLASYFYTNDGLVASTQPERLQRNFDVLTGIFDRFHLQKNTANTVGMVCQPFHAPGSMSEDAYV